MFGGRAPSTVPIQNRSQMQRIEDLEHDNNVLRDQLAEVRIDNARIAYDLEKITGMVKKLTARFGEFADRMAAVN